MAAQPDNDAWLGGAAALAAAIAFGWSAVVATTPLPETDRPVVARVAQTSVDLRLRPASTLGWRSLITGDSVREADAIFVPPGGAAQLKFSDGTVLELDEQSLVVVEPPKGATRSVTLRQGSVSGTAGDAGLTVATAAGSATLNAGTEARVELSKQTVNVAVDKGEAKLSGPKGEAAVTTGARAQSSDAKVETLASLPLSLKTPPVGWRRRYSPGVAVALAWAGLTPTGARVQLARDRLFAFVWRQQEARANSAEATPPSAGVVWWRLIDEDGEPLSEARRFLLVEDEAPKLLSPREGEVVNVAGGALAPFSWARVQGASTYRVELSSAPTFDDVALSREVHAEQARLALDLPEGSWHWRVRALDPELGPGATSAGRRFRLILKAIPAAPELLSPEIEVSK